MIPNHRKVGTGYTRTGDVLVWNDWRQLVLTDHSGYHTTSTQQHNENHLQEATTKVSGAP